MENPKEQKHRHKRGVFLMLYEICKGSVLLLFVGVVLFFLLFIAMCLI